MLSSSHPVALHNLDLRRESRWKIVPLTMPRNCTRSPELVHAYLHVWSWSQCGPNFGEKDGLPLPSMAVHG